MCTCTYARARVSLRMCMCMSAFGMGVSGCRTLRSVTQGVEWEVKDREGPERGRHLKIMTIHTVVSILAMAYCQQILSFP